MGDPFKMLVEGHPFAHDPKRPIDRRWFRIYRIGMNVWTDKPIDLSRTRKTALPP